jgi:putative transposase
VGVQPAREGVRLLPSMGGVGACFATAMTRVVMVPGAGRAAGPARWRTRIELANAIFKYLEIFHNRQRRHSALGMLSPTEFENLQPTTVA